MCFGILNNKLNIMRGNLRFKLFCILFNVEKELFLYSLGFPIRGSNSYFIGAYFIKLYF